MPLVSKFMKWSGQCVTESFPRTVAVRNSSNQFGAGLPRASVNSALQSQNAATAGFTRNFLTPACSTNSTASRKVSTVTWSGMLLVVLTKNSKVFHGTLSWMFLNRHAKATRSLESSSIAKSTRSTSAKPRVNRLRVHRAFVSKGVGCLVFNLAVFARAFRNPSRFSWFSASCAPQIMFSVRCSSQSLYSAELKNLNRFAISPSVKSCADAAAGSFVSLLAKVVRPFKLAGIWQPTFFSSSKMGMKCLSWLKHLRL